MANFKWTIRNLTMENNVISHAEYHVVATDGDHKVDTEGNWQFHNQVEWPADVVLTPDQAAILLEKDSTIHGVNVIKSRLEEQLNVLKNGVKNTTPWKTSVFVAKL